MSEVFTSTDVFDVVIAICIFITGYLFGRMRGRSASVKRMRKWDTEK